jgi:hypothetical protein
MPWHCPACQTQIQHNPAELGPRHNVRFHGESYGWEAQFFERGELVYSRGAFVTRACIGVAQLQRDAMERL